MADQTTEQDKQPVGRPLKYKTVAELDQAINAYFDECDPHVAKRMVETGTKADGDTMFELRNVMTEQKPYTMSGLAHAMGISRQTLLDYGNRDEFLDTLDSAKARVHRYAEEQLFSKSATGAVFSLKNNWGWRDQSQVDHTSGGAKIEAPTVYVSAIKPRDADDAATTTETPG